MNFNFYSIPPLISSFIFIILGLFVFLKNRKSIVNFLFFLMCCTTFGWQFTWFILFTFPIDKLVPLLIKIGYSWIIFIPITFYHFAMRFIKAKKVKKIIFFSYVLGSFFLIANWTSAIFVNGYYKYFWGHYPKASYLHPIYLVMLFYLSLDGLSRMWLKIKHEQTSALRKNQIRYLIFGIALYIFASTDFIVNYGIEFYPLGFVFITLCFSTIAYAILRYRLMDIEVIIRETAVFAGIFGFAVGAFVLVMQVGQMFLEPYISDNPFVFPAMALFLVTIAVRPIEKLTYNTVGKFLFKKRQKYQKALKDAAEGMATIRKPQRLLGLITHIISKNLRPANVAVYVFDDEKKTYSLSAARYLSKIDKNLEFSNEEPLISHLKENKQPIIFEEVEHWLREEQARPHKEVLASDLAGIKDKLSSLNASICIPSFYHKNELLGFLVLGDKKSGDLYAQDDLELLDSLADEAGIAIRNSMLYIKLQHKEEEVSQIYEREQTMFMHAAHAFANAIDARDPYTHGHSQRVTKYSLALVDQMEEARFGSVEKHKWFKQRLQLAGLLHDIGKIAIPDSILQKNEKLNDEEWKKMKEHPVIGANVLSYVRGLWDIVPAVKYHHERYDGKGYPDGLKQENIPFMARIMSVADVFDAMTSNRPYRKARIAEESKQEINNNSATQFDPYTVGAFMKAYAKSLITKIMEQDR